MLTRDLSGERAGAPTAILAVAVFLMSASVLLFIAILVRPAPSPWRRCLGILVDMLTTSAAMGIAGESGAPLLAIYLWVIIGNGFRFGTRYLGIAAAAALIGFGSVSLWSEFWRGHPVFSASFFLVLLLIPAYAAVLLKKLNDAVRVANEANAAKSQFLAKMSHELRTPLNGVIGMSDLLMDFPLESQQHAFARTIQSSAQTLLGIIENILDFSKIEAGRIGVECVDFDLHQLLSDTVRMFRPQSERKSLRLTLHIDPEVPFLLRGDPLQTRQILTNLIGNAIKFTEKGGVEVRVTLFGPRLAPGTRRLRFEIEDTGIGIAAAEHERIFESFRQADSSTTRLYGGTGLGAAIARELTMLLGGQIGFSSTLGQGSLFWVELPFSVQPQDTEAGQRSLADTRVLIVGAAGLGSRNWQPPGHLGFASPGGLVIGAGIRRAAAGERRAEALRFGARGGPGFGSDPARWRRACRSSARWHRAGAGQCAARPGHQAGLAAGRVWDRVVCAFGPEFAVQCGASGTKHPRPCRQRGLPRGALPPTRGSGRRAPRFGGRRQRDQSHGPAGYLGTGGSPGQYRKRRRGGARPVGGRRP